VKEKELPRKVFLESTLYYCNNEKLLPVKAFYLSCLENQSLNENNIENVKIQLTTIYNKMLRNAATVEAEIGEPKDMIVTPQDIVQEALSKWMLLENFTSKNLNAIAQLNDIPDTTKKQIASILETRSGQESQRKRKKSRRQIDDTRSIDSSN